MSASTMIAASGLRPPRCAPTVSANHLMKPTRARPSASATKVANHASVFQASLYEVMSLHLMTLVISISAMTTKAAVVAFITSPPKTHSSKAITTYTSNSISFFVRPPILVSSLAAHCETSEPSLTSGGQSLYANSGTIARRFSPSGMNAMNQGTHSSSTLTVFLTTSIASTFGARPVMNIELVTQVAAMATHIRYEPILREEGSFGFEPYKGGRLLITGYIVPPLRAVLDGVNGAISRSANCTA